MSSNDLLDKIKDEFKLKSDADLARFLDVSPPAVSKIRHGHCNIGGDSILNIYDKTGWSIERIRETMKGAAHALPELPPR